MFGAGGIGAGALLVVLAHGVLVPRCQWCCSWCSGNGVGSLLLVVVLAPGAVALAPGGSLLLVVMGPWCRWCWFPVVPGALVLASASDVDSWCRWCCTCWFHGCWIIHARRWLLVLLVPVVMAPGIGSLIAASGDVLLVPVVLA